jgi:hypothetical protein
MRCEDLVGRRFGKLRVLKLGERVGNNGAGRDYHWICQCECGNQEERSGNNLRRSLRYGRQIACKVCEARNVSARRKGKRGDNTVATYRRKNGAPATYVPAMQQAKQEQYLKQEGLCDVCHKPLPEKVGAACWDHDHKTGNLRSLVHHTCNVIIGYLESFPGIETDVREYLRKYELERQSQFGSSQ